VSENLYQSEEKRSREGTLVRAIAPPLIIKLHRKTLSGTACFEEFIKNDWVCSIAPLCEHPIRLRAASGKDDIGAPVLFTSEA
jgi:hypothetical protein